MSRIKFLVIPVLALLILASLVMGLPMVTGKVLSLFGFSGSGGGRDPGRQLEELVKSHTMDWFGLGEPLGASAVVSAQPYRTKDQGAEEQLLLASGLRVRYLTREAANKTDQMAFWPNASAPTHLITCVETSLEKLADGRFNPSVQRIELGSGRVETVLRGMDRCDGIRLTPWGTILVAEEVAEGGAYELLNPLAVTNLLAHRQEDQKSDQLAFRGALPTMSWEGIAILPSGVVIASDETMPGERGLDSDGGSIYKFIPDKPRAADAKPIATLNQSPLTAGKVYALQISCLSSNEQRFPKYGQGCEQGQGAWVAVRALPARNDADRRGATGYFRPEDLEADPLYDGAGLRFCWAATGNEAAGHFGEVICALDPSPITAKTIEIKDERTGFGYLGEADRPTPVRVNRFILGDRDFNSFDNLAFQPGSGLLYVTEDRANGDVFACLPDGGDRDLITDACLKVMSAKDSSAEPTGLLFSADGTTAYLAIQQSDDRLMPLVDGYPTDDILVISGFKVPKLERGKN